MQTVQSNGFLKWSLHQGMLWRVSFSLSTHGPLYDLRNPGLSAMSCVSAFCWKLGGFSSSRSEAVVLVNDTSSQPAFPVFSHWNALNTSGLWRPLFPIPQNPLKIRHSTCKIQPQTDFLNKYVTTTVGGFDFSRSFFNLNFHTVFLYSPNGRNESLVPLMLSFHTSQEWQGSLEDKRCTSISNSHGN